MLKGNQRSGAKNLALHLLKDENDHVEIHELRGFVSDDLISALYEAHAISRATKCKQFLYSLSLNPPQEARVSIQDFEAAIERIETKLGLTGQPRAIVFHEKNARRHCHVVWSRIDAAEMNAVPLPFTKNKLKALSRELFLEHGWRLPEGLMESHKRDPRNFTHAQWQQAKRNGKDPRMIKAAIQDCWAVSDTQTSFTHALKQRGYVLARGDRRGFVAIDFDGEIYSVPKWTGLRAKDVRVRLTNPAALPTVSEAQRQITLEMTKTLKGIFDQQSAAFDGRASEITEKIRLLTQKHKVERENLARAQAERTNQETKYRQSRYRAGLLGLFDQLAGKRKRINLEKSVEIELFC